MAKTYAFVQRIKLIDVKNVTPHVRVARNMVHRRYIDAAKIVKILAKHFERQQRNQIREKCAERFVRNHRAEMEQRIEAGTNLHHVDVFHAVEEHVRDADAAGMRNELNSVVCCSVRSGNIGVI